MASGQSISSLPAAVLLKPAYKWAEVPIMHRHSATPPEKPHYDDIHMPKNTATGFIIAVFSAAFGFAMVWHITWLIAAGLIGIVATIIRRTFDFDTDYYVKAAEVERIEAEYASGVDRARQAIEAGDLDTGTLTEAT